VKVSFGIYKIMGVQEERCRGAGRNNPNMVATQWAWANKKMEAVSS